MGKYFNPTRSLFYLHICSPIGCYTWQHSQLSSLFTPVCSGIVSFVISLKTFEVFAPLPVCPIRGCSPILVWRLLSWSPIPLRPMSNPEMVSYAFKKAWDWASSKVKEIMRRNTWRLVSELWTMRRGGNHFLEPDFIIKASDSLRFILLADSPTQWNI